MKNSFKPKVRQLKLSRYAIRLGQGICCLLWLAGCVSPPPPPLPPPAHEPEAEPRIPPPRVMVILMEKGADNQPLAEVAPVATRHLLIRNIPVVDQAVIQDNRTKIQSLLTSAGDEQGAAAIGLQFGAEVIIRGEAEVRRTATSIRGSNLNSYQGTVNLRAIYADDGSILATTTANGTTIALDDVSGSSRALQNAADQALEQLLPAMLTSWREIVERPGGALSMSAVLNTDDEEAPILLPPPPPEYSPEVAALWRLTPHTGVQEEWMDPLTETLHTVILRSGWFRLVTRDDMAKIMQEHNIQLSDICDTTERAVEFGKIMSARKMLIGTVGKLGNTYQIVLRLVDVETGEIEKAGRAEARGTMDVLFRLTQLAAANMLQATDRPAR